MYALAHIDGYAHGTVRALYTSKNVTFSSHLELQPGFHRNPLFNTPATISATRGLQQCPLWSSELICTCKMLMRPTWCCLVSFWIPFHGHLCLFVGFILGPLTPLSQQVHQCATNFVQIQLTMRIHFIVDMDSLVMCRKSGLDSVSGRFVLCVCLYTTVGRCENSPPPITTTTTTTPQHQHHLRTFEGLSTRTTSYLPTYPPNHLPSLPPTYLPTLCGFWRAVWVEKWSNGLCETNRWAQSDRGCVGLE